jgi:hypothetical protein
VRRASPSRSRSQARSEGFQSAARTAEVGLARERRVQWLESPGRLEQERRRVAAARLRERDLRVKQLSPSTVELGQRSRLRHCQQSQRRVGRARAVLAGRRGQRALGTALRVRRELCGALVERGLRRQAAPSARTCGRVLQLGGDILVEPVRRVGAVPRAAIRIGIRIRGACECPVDARALVRCRRAIDRRPHQRMPEAHPRPELDQAHRRCRPCRGRVDAQLRGRLPHEQRIADRLGGCDEKQEPSRRRQRREPLPEAFLDATRERGVAVQPEPTRQLVRRPAARKLEQRQRVAACLGDDPIAHTLVQRARHDALQQRLGVPLVQAVDDQLREPVEMPLAGRLAHGEHKADRLGLQTAGHERQSLRRCLVEPLRVVDDADERAPLGRVGQEAQEGQADEEAIRGVGVADAKRRAERVALRAGETFEPIDERRAELMNARECKLHL